MSRTGTQVCGVCQSVFGDSDCVHWTGSGTTDDPYVPALNINETEGNLVRCGPSGVGAFPPQIYLDPPAAHVYGAIQQDAIVPYDTPWPLVFTEQRYDTDNMHNPEDAPDRITFNTPGIYLVTLNIRWRKTRDLTATGDMAAFIWKNGTQYIALDSFPVPNEDSFAKQSISTIRPFAAGEYVTALVKQDVVDGDNEPMNLPITIERMSPIFSAIFLRSLEGMSIIGMET